MADLIDRQAAIDALERYKNDDPMYSLDDNVQGWNDGLDTAIELLKELPSAQKDANEYRKQGEWEMFELITSAWYGKQYYFKEENGMAYSRKSHKNMTVHDAILEFIGEIADE